MTRISPRHQSRCVSGVTRYVRYQKGSVTAHGILEGDTVQPIEGELLGSHKRVGSKQKLSEVKLLYPIVPPKILAVGLNYRSHIGSAKPPVKPEIFFKPGTSLQHPGDPIVIPAGFKNTHYEGELVIVMSKKASKVSSTEAKNAIFRVTCGNDVSERDWQHGAEKDLQWWRAKGADTFGPCGPYIAQGLDYGKLRLQTRLNGKIVRSSRLPTCCSTALTLSASSATM